MATATPLPRELQPRPDPDAIDQFCDLLFGYADGWVPVRLLAETGGPDFRPETPFERTDENLADALLRHAERAWQAGAALYVVPGTVAQPGKARATDLVQLTTVLVDLDKGDIDACRNHLLQHLGPASLEVASGGVTPEGRQKRHLYWRLAEPAEGTDIALACEARAQIARKVGGDPSFASAHQPIRVAGSVHAKGGILRPVEILGTSDREVDLAEFAETAAAMPPMPAVTKTPEMKPEKAPRVTEFMLRKIRQAGIDGTTRYAALSSVIGYWLRRAREGRVSLDEAWMEVVGYNQAMIVPPWPDTRLRRDFERLRQVDLRNHGAAHELDHDGTPGTLPAPAFSEDALAETFSRGRGADWRYVAPWGRWLGWTGTHWQRDETGKAPQQIRLVCRAAAQSLEKPREARRLASASTIVAVDRIARSDPRHAATADEWDPDPELLNTPAGIIDLRTGEVLPHDRAAFMTRMAGASPGGDCPGWERFLGEITAWDHAIIGYLARIAGYCLTGLTTEQVLFFLHGSGANGKSVFLSVLAAILGDYATSAPIETFVAGPGERHPTDLAGLAGARLATVAETEESRRWAESKIKAVTGGDPIKARFMRKDFFEYTPQFKLVVAGNHMPALRTLDEAMRRRIHLVPFAVTIPRERRDPGLVDTLLAERAGILAWALGGLAEWRRMGLAPPHVVTGATEQYFESEDMVGEWLAERCRPRPDAFTPSSRLYTDWKAWAEAVGEPVRTKNWLGRELTRRGYPDGRESGARGFWGLSLAPGASDAAHRGSGS